MGATCEVLHHTHNVPLDVWLQVLSHAMSAPGMEERLGEQLLRNLVWVVRAMLLQQQQGAESCAPVLARTARAGRLHFGAVVSVATVFPHFFPKNILSIC